MVGNSKGWMIAAGIAAAFGLIALVNVMPIIFGVRSGPTTATVVSGKLDLWDMKTPLSSIVESVPVGAGNAGEDYFRALRILRDNKGELAVLSSLLRSGEKSIWDLKNRPPRDRTEDEIADLIEASMVDFTEAAMDIMDHVASGADKAEMTFMLKYTPAALQVAGQLEAVAEFGAMADLLLAAGGYYRVIGESGKAQAVIEDVCVMGWHMFNERGNVGMMMDGLITQEKAAIQLQYVYEMLGDDDKRAMAEAYMRAAKALGEKLKAKAKILDPPQKKGDKLVIAKAGDVFNIVENDKDRAWRVEGILTLGVLKAQKSGVRGLSRNDERAVRELIEEYLESDDPLLRAAAEAARDFTFGAAEEPEPQPEPEPEADAPEDSD